ncbi:MAG: DUF1080 domain-containing protein, partial [Bacteroidetes bacterium]|nr:DUF1080 domain-containing protein [Bacteroidota bacterium]
MRNLQNFAILLWVLLLFTDVQAQDNWISLSKGRDLKSWKQLGGVAEYKVIDGVIIGTTKSNTANSFLCTKQNYSDFILELEMWVDPAVNSGIQIRSNSLQDYKNGRVHGYQVETDPSPRAFSGGIYDEGRRGWLYPLSRNTNAQKALKNGVWNKYHIEAIGNTISTWINGIQCTKLVDDMTSEGFIGLQVHSINDSDLVGREVKWRNIKILTNNLEGNRWV